MFRFSKTGFADPKRYARLAVCCLLAVLASTCLGTPKVLKKEPLRSPNGAWAANVEWEDLGFVGLLRTKIYDAAGKLLRSAELPQVDPSPARLIWVDDNWVACESFLGEKTGSFFYTNAPTGKGYLVEIFEPTPDSTWVFTMASNDPISSEPIANVSRGQRSLFPVLLADVPQSEGDFYTPEFISRLVTSIETYNEFRRRNNITRIDLMSDADVRPGLGGVVVASIDGRPQVVYFPTEVSSPRDLLSRVHRQILPDDVAKLLKSPGAPHPRVRWLQGSDYVVEGLQSDPSTSGTTTSVLARSHFEGLTITPVQPTPSVGTGSVSTTASEKQIAPTPESAADKRSSTRGVKVAPRAVPAKRSNRH